MNFNLSNYLPVGFSLKKENTILGFGFGIAIGYSFRFLVNYLSERGGLYEWRGDKKLLMPDAIMPDFVDLFQTSLRGYVLLAALILIFIGIHYAYHYQGSKSIYLMRRLPNRMELHKRCLSYPLFCIGLCILLAVLTLFVYFAIYMVFTPKQCLSPDQWQKLWSVIL